MSKVFIQEETLTSIGDAIREKAGTTDLIDPANMAQAIEDIPSGGEELGDIVISGYMPYDDGGSNGIFDNFIFKKVPQLLKKIKIQDLKTVHYLFRAFPGDTMPQVNMATDYSATERRYSFTHTFSGTQLKKINKIDNIKFQPTTWLTNFIYYNNNLETIDNDFFNNFVNPNELNYICGSSAFKTNPMLQNLPDLSVFNNLTAGTNYYYDNFYYNLLDGDYRLLNVNLPVIHMPEGMTSSLNYYLYNTFVGLNNLRHLTFMPVDKSNWRKVVIDLSGLIGSFNNTSSVQKAGIPLENKIANSDLFDLHKDNDNWYSLDIGYSKYTHDSAVETINSLPDCSEIVSTLGTDYINTIQFRGSRGSLTPEGAISDLTEEEIAVAAAKGWTVSIV